MASLSEDTKAMIAAICSNDMPRARKAARAAVTNRNTKKDEWFCGKYSKLLDESINPELLQLPYQIKGMVIEENLAVTFPAEQYFLSDREAEVIAHIERMRRIADRLAEMNINYRNATLLHGVSGTGKTMFARYAAWTFKLPFYYVNFSSLVDSYMGKTSSNIASVFDYVKTVPCVFMLDEIDAISTRRRKGSSGADGEINRITITLLQEFDKVTRNQIIIAATNRIDSIDEALIRRFSKLHEVTVPTDEERREIVRTFIEASQYEPAFADCDRLFEETSGMSQARITEACVEAIVARIDEEEGGNDANH